MKQFSLSSIVGCLLCVGILYLGLSSGQVSSSRLNADDIAQKKAEVDRADALVKQLIQSLEDQRAINSSLTKADERTIETIANLQSSIQRLGEHVKDSVPTREEVTRLVSTKADQISADGESTCAEKLADLQKQIDELKAKVASLDCNPAKTSSTAASTSSYGSTGTVQYSYSQPVYSTPVYSTPVYSQPVTTFSSSSGGCYTDPITGQVVCPASTSSSQPSVRSTFFPRLRTRFNN